MQSSNSGHQIADEQVRLPAESLELSSALDPVHAQNCANSIHERVLLHSIQTARQRERERDPKGRRMGDQSGTGLVFPR